MSSKSTTRSRFFSLVGSVAGFFRTLRTMFYIPFTRRNFSNLPLLISILLLLYVYLLFVFLLPLAASRFPDPHYFRNNAIICVVAFSLTFIAYHKCVATNPGAVPNGFNVRKDPRYQYCGTCAEYRPPRTHHCSMCGQCVMRYDHHCVWIDNCVGASNHKFFFLFLLYISICILHYASSVSNALFAFAPSATASRYATRQQQPQRSRAPRPQRRAPPPPPIVLQPRTPHPRVGDRAAFATSAFHANNRIGGGWYGHAYANAMDDPRPDTAHVHHTDSGPHAYLAISRHPAVGLASPLVRSVLVYMCGQVQLEAVELHRYSSLAADATEASVDGLHIQRGGKVGAQSMDAAVMPSSAGGDQLADARVGAGCAVAVGVLDAAASYTALVQTLHLSLGWGGGDADEDGAIADGRYTGELDGGRVGDSAVGAATHAHYTGGAALTADEASVVSSGDSTQLALSARARTADAAAADHAAGARRAGSETVTHAKAAHDGAPFANANHAAGAPAMSGPSAAPNNVKAPRPPLARAPTGASAPRESAAPSTIFILNAILTVVVTVLIFPLALFAMGFVAFHGYLIASDKTTFDASFGADPAKATGWLTGINHVMGPQPLLWLLPTDVVRGGGDVGCTAHVLLALVHGLPMPITRLHPLSYPHSWSTLLYASDHVRIYRYSPHLSLQSSASSPPHPRRLYYSSSPLTTTTMTRPTRLDRMTFQLSPLTITDVMDCCSMVALCSSPPVVVQHAEFVFLGRRMVPPLVVRSYVAGQPPRAAATRSSVLRDLKYV